MAKAGANIPAAEGRAALTRSEFLAWSLNALLGKEPELSAAGGNGTKRPILLMAHSDVVGVQREKWPVDPFGAVVKDGYVWGRGTADDKDKLAANLMTILLAKRKGVPLDMAPEGLRPVLTAMLQPNPAERLRSILPVPVRRT